MTERDSDSCTLRRRWTRFSLAWLLGVLTISAVLIAWLADHRRLVEQIGPQPQKTAVLYPLSNASARLASERLNELFQSERILPDPTSNAIIVNAERINHERIRMILLHIDRKGTEYIEPVALESETGNETSLSGRK